MKYQLEIEIQKPRDAVLELFDNPSNMKKWQPSLLEYRHLSGEQGQPGAKSEQVHKLGKRDVTMIETITKRNLPDELSATYEVKNCFNSVHNTFEELSATSTKWIVRTEFTFQGYMKIMAFLMPGAFKKETRKHMESFKNFVESAE